MPNIALIVNNILSDSGVPITYSTSGTGGTSGVNGTSGTSATSGSSGTSASSGISGSSGTAGTSGSSGTSASSGSSGTSGTSASSGSSGTSGTSASSGSSGTSGTKGTSGTSGANGAAGSSGTSGTKGTSGTSGANGAAGSSGTSGTKGTSGTSGANGANGSSGTSGAGTISGTTNTVAKFTAATTIGNSNITDDGTTITLASNTTVNGSFKFYIRSNQSGYGQIQIGATTAGGEASIAFVGGVSSGLGTSGPTSGDGTGAVWAIGSNVYSIGTTVFGIGNASAGGAVFRISSAGAATITSSSTQPIRITSSAALTTGYADAFQMLFANQTGGGVSLNIGKAESTRNLAKVVYNHVADGSTSNRLGFGFFDADSLLNVLAGGNVGIGTSSPSNKLHIDSADDNAYALRVQGNTNNASGVWTGIGIAGESTNTKSAILFVDNGSSYSRGDLVFAINNAADQNIATPSNAVMTLKAGGAVLVGTTSENSFASANSIQINGSSGALVETRYNGTSGLRMGSSSDHGYLFEPRAVYMRFGTSDTERMRITSGGNVGINTSTPDVTFHVNGKSYIGTMTNYTPAVHIRGAFYGGPRLQVYGLDADANGWMGLGTDMSNSPYELSIYYPTNASSSVTFGRYDGTATQYGGYTTTARLSNAGTWTVAGDVVAYGSPSDVSLKQNIKPIEDALEKVLELEGVSFDWIEETEVNSLTGIKEDLGFIAQQVQKVIPKLVRENSNGKLSLRDKGITPYLVEAIKEQQKQIEELKTLINGFTS